MKKKLVLLGCGGVLAALLLGALVLFLVGRSTYNSLVALDEGVAAGWSQVENVYQRRADLVPNLVATVQGAADFERETLEAVISARSQATSVQVSASDLQNPQALARFEAAQGALSSALSRLMVVVERYPDIKANQNFLSLQDELAGTENRIAVERRRFNEAAQAYNVERRTFPTIVIANFIGFEEAAYFEADEGAETAPAVDFSR
ncbi:MAG: LemA family protein [Acidobacteria bacterium]|nr:LemA family protein [Acidobacteriota bacterium]